MANQSESAFVFVTPQMQGKTIFQLCIVRFSSWRVPEYCNCLSQGNESRCIISFSRKRRTTCDTKSSTTCDTNSSTKCGTERCCPVKNQWEAAPNGPPWQLGLKTFSRHFSFGCRPGASALWQMEGCARWQGNPKQPSCFETTARKPKGADYARPLICQPRAKTSRCISSFQQANELPIGQTIKITRPETQSAVSFYGSISFSLEVPFREQGMPAMTLPRAPREAHVIDFLSADLGDLPFSVS